MAAAAGSGKNNKDKYEKLKEAIEWHNVKRIKQIVPTIDAELLNKFKPLHILAVNSYDSSGKLIADNLFIIADILISAGADLDLRDNEGNRPLHYTVRKGAIGMTKFLIDKGADPQKGDGLGFTPYYYALLQNNGTLIDLFKSIGATKQLVKGSLASIYGEHKWDDVITSSIPSVYLLMGHGTESVCFEERNILPDGYNLITVTECGVPEIRNNSNKLIKSLKLKLISEDKEDNLKALIDASPIKNMKEILGTDKIRIYNPGDKIPSIMYTPSSIKEDREDKKIIGIDNIIGVQQIDLESIKEFPIEHTVNINKSIDPLSIIKKSYDTSIYPTSDMYVSMISNIIKEKDKKKIPMSTSLSNLINNLTRVNVFELMKKIGPGTYIFPLCRTATCIRPGFDSFVMNAHTRKYMKTSDMTSYLYPINKGVITKIARVRRLSNDQQSKYATNHTSKNTIKKGGRRKTRRYRIRK